MEHIYIIGDSSSNVLRFKVGLHTGTINDLIKRYITYIPDLSVHLFYPVVGASEVEKHIKKKLKPIRCTNVRGNDSEWYSASLKSLLTDIILLLGDNPEVSKTVSLDARQDCEEEEEDEDENEKEVILTKKAKKKAESDMLNSENGIKKSPMIVNPASPNKTPKLMKAIIANNITLTKKYVSEGMDPSWGKNAPIVSAIENGFTDIVKFLLADKRVNPSPNGKRKHILAAIKADHLDVIRILLTDARINFYTFTTEYLNAAIITKNSSMLILLLNGGKLDPSLDVKFILEYLCNVGSTTTLSEILSHERCSPKDWDSNFIADACKSGKSETVAILLADGRFDPAANQSEALRTAIKSSNEEMVKLLLDDKRCHPGAAFGSAILIAVRLGNYNIVKMLMDDKRTNPAVKNNEALKIAIQNYDTKIVALLRKDPRVLEIEKGTTV